MGREAGLGDDRGESARVASGGHGQRVSACRDAVGQCGS
jgi:hypothetical protein